MEQNETGMLAPACTSSRPSVMASALDMMELELSLELSSAPLGNVSLTGAIDMSVGAARLAPSGITSMLLVTIGIPGLERPESPSTTGIQWQLKVLCLLTGPESPDALFGVVKLALSDNACLTSITNQLLAMADVPGLTTGVIDSACGYTRQTAPAWVDVGSGELYPGARSLQPDFGITEARQSAYLGQRHVSGQAASDPPFGGMDPVHVPSWTRPIGTWVRAPQASATTGPPLDVSTECLRTGFTSEAWGTWPPVEPVGAS